MHVREEVKESWDKTDETQKPSMAIIHTYVNNILFEDLCEHLEKEYQSKPVLEYSKCSLQRGWNVKYKKAGRTLCTLYPMSGYFIALVVINVHEQDEFELVLPTFTEYVQQLYYDTNAGMGQRWLMLHVTEHTVLEDVKQCIRIRRGNQKKSSGHNGRGMQIN